MTRHHQICTRRASDTTTHYQTCSRQPQTPLDMLLTPSDTTRNHQTCSWHHQTPPDTTRHPRCITFCVSPLVHYPQCITFDASPLVNHLWSITPGHHFEYIQEDFLLECSVLVFVFVCVFVISRWTLVLFSFFPTMYDMWVAMLKLMMKKTVRSVLDGSDKLIFNWLSRRILKYWKNPTRHQSLFQVPISKGTWGEEGKYESKVVISSSGKYFLDISSAMQ